MTGTAHLYVNLDAYTGDDSPPLPTWTSITLDPQGPHPDPVTDRVHVGVIVVRLDSAGVAITANGAPVTAGRVPVLAGVTYAISGATLSGTVGPLTDGQDVARRYSHREDDSFHVRFCCWTWVHRLETGRRKHRGMMSKSTST